MGKKIDKVIEFKVDPAVLTERVVGRWIHKASGRSYHTKFNPPKVEGIDDVTGEPLMHRSDDTAETVTTRMASYDKDTSPVLDYYRKKNVLSTIDAMANIDDVWKNLHSVVHDNII
jgi:adenylate kinase